MIRFRCPTCKNEMQAPDVSAGAKLNCPACGQRVQVPPAHGAAIQPVVPLAVPPPGNEFDFGGAPEEVPVARDPGSGVAAFVCGLLGLLTLPLFCFYCFPGIVPVVLSLVAISLRTDPRDGLGQAGKIMGWISMVIGISTLLVVVFLAGISVLGSNASGKFKSVADTIGGG